MGGAAAVLAEMEGLRIETLGEGDDLVTRQGEFAAWDRLVQHEVIEVDHGR
jgi:hypothetical protein